ncbi:MAG TPA: TetR-like C-terminal domain-containing protein [Isosphaeraceae bacterium]|nr:TetR-like C-terminal domain-containing protein [Isosphaeraceae bacterium]
MRGRDLSAGGSGLDFEEADETGMSAAGVRERELTGEPTAMEILLDRAVARGEIDPGRLSPRIASLPLDLVRHDLIMNRAPAPDKTLVEIVDRIFLPLVLAGRPEQTGQAVSPASA